MTGVSTMSRTGVPADGRATPGTAARRGAGIPLTRLIVVELRKLTDTRAGLWLLIATVLAAVAMAAVTAAEQVDHQTLAMMLRDVTTPVSMLLPVLGTLAMTGEWSHRTALTTFTLTPARGRVLTAKLVAAIVAGLAAATATLVVAAGGVMVSGARGAAISWRLDATVLAGTALYMVISVLVGSAFGALLHNPAPAIVAYFIVPQSTAVATVLIRPLNGITSWVNFRVATGQLLGSGMTAGEWARLGTVVLLWLVLPLTVGLVRTLRREVG